MTFLDKNKNFIRIKFHSNMKGMSFDEKKAFYVKNLREETIKRIRNHFYESHNDVIINASDETLDLFTSAKNDLNIIV